MQYNFRDLQPTNKNEYEDIPTEGFVFGSFDSREVGWWVVSREAPTPTENEIVEQVAYTQGVYVSQCLMVNVSLAIERSPIKSLCR